MMDQTTDSADLTETEKYLLCRNEGYSESDSDSGTEEVAQDTLLGGIRSGLSTITRTARKSLATCKNETELNDEVHKIEEASLKLLKLERSFLKTASIVSDVIEDLASDYEDDDENIQPIFSPEANGNDENGSGDASSTHTKPEPYIFRVSERNLASVINYKEKLSEEFHKRLDTYEKTLTNKQLKRDKKFTALLDQIKLGRNADAEISMQKAKNTGTELEEKNDGENSLSKQSSASSFLSSLPYSAEELLGYQYKPYNEDDDMDHSVLPSIDPISKNPIRLPVRNKYCNHVFDRDSIGRYIASNHLATCPVHMCRNKRPLAADHFVADSILTSHVRRKNNFE